MDRKLFGLVWVALVAACVGCSDVPVPVRLLCRDDRPGRKADRRVHDAARVRAWWHARSAGLSIKTDVSDSAGRPGGRRQYGSGAGQRDSV